MSAERLKNYINGAWVEAAGSDSLEIENPSTGAILGSVPLSTEADVDAAVSAARQAFPGWSSTPVSRRIKSLYKLVELLKQNEKNISRVLVEEMGKSLPDAAAEVKRALENTEVACGMPTLQQGDKVVGCADGIDGETLRLPVGVFAIISPFNFPAMVPFWFLPYALATGNTVVLKVSEQDPRTFNLIAEYIDQIGLPPGVFNMVHGDKQVVEALLDHPVIKGVSFVGSSRVAGLVMEKCAAARKRCQSMGGAKNHLVAMPDAKVSEVVRNMITSCYGCAGQRCMAASAIVGVGDAMYETICREFIAASKKVLISDPLDPAVADEAMVLGPVISARSKAFIQDMIETGVNEGATLALDGRNVSVPGCEKGHFIGPTVFTDVKPGMEIHRTEIFGPVVVILKAADLDEAIKIINDHQYGNGASIYTQNGYYARRFKLETECGMIGINVGIPAPVAYLPFGGMKDSLYSDIKAQGKSVINFFTEEKIVTERYWGEEG
ncbi:MAG: CoA-acylating methylmalonate-semialdehyde dehydrogenase [Kiritimatiellia bacterium]|jgi:malonate-semialdehyde dehydrogenase (acetylating)/methylmalonate-semialdehyde dehydrogenase|nr:CoA-acylating methylmalonate-semialdehyde dehydrogenase [Kiritimatiellia bacterium]MDP6848190.1 CoA-acylating methylmalonate-semialdehyde dehydrogenase [Kiritimatiellia bacterium]